MKKLLILSGALTMLLMFSSSALAEEITVEGENYTRAGYNPYQTSSKELSGGAAMYTYHTFGEKKPSGKVEYDFTLSEGGYFGLIATTTIVDVNYTANYTVSVNGADPVGTDKFSFIETVKTDLWGSALKRYNVGNFYFKKGKNTVIFDVDLNDTNPSNQIVFYIDKFDLVKEPFAISSVTASRGCNVYEPGMQTEFEIKFKGLCPPDTLYSYKITDFWGSVLKEDSFTCKDGSNTHRINVGSYDVGWYKLSLTDKSGKSAYRDIYFSVVPKESDRIGGESPFAADLASMYLVPDSGRLKDIARAARLAGIKYIRDRYTWSIIQKGADRDHNFAPMEEYRKIISNEGIDISDIFADIPSWTKNTRLFDIYNVMKASAAHFGDQVDVWEFLNEVDGNFAQWPGDLYSAMYKAAALGVKDSGSNSRTSFAGLCIYVRDSLFTDVVMKNDVMKYSDIYNLHCHVTENNDLVQDIETDHISDHRELKMLGSDEAKPFWMTEAGIYQRISGSGLSKEQQQKQARYLVTSTADSLAAGTSKHFWFILAPYVENNQDMGIFTPNYEPMPGYEAEAVMSYVLGKGIMKGVLAKDTADGYVFDSGRGDVLVLWTDEPRDITLLSDSDVKVTDIMGHERVVPSVDGRVTFGISHYPSYVSYNGSMPVSDYYPKSYKADDSIRCEYTDCDRVIIRQEFDQDLATAKKAGYKLAAGKNEQLRVVIYNFNDKEISGKLCGELDGYEVSFATEDVTVPAMGEVTVNATLTPKTEPDYNKKKYMRIFMDMNGEKSSPSVSCVYVFDDRYEAPEIPLADKANEWDVSNITSGAAAEAKKNEDAVEFTLKFNGGDRWFYPHYKIEDADVLGTMDGIMFWVKTAEENIGQGNHNMFAYLSDGREYYLGSTTDITFRNEWVKIKRPWSEFVLFRSPLGAVDIRPFDPTLIESISVGCNARTNNVKYQIKDFGLYKNDETAAPDMIEFRSPELEQAHSGAELADIQIYLPERYKLIKLMLTDDDLTQYIVDGNIIHVDLSTVERGSYILRVIAEDETGYRESATAEVTIGQGGM